MQMWRNRKQNCPWAEIYIYCGLARCTVEVRAFHIALLGDNTAKPARVGRELMTSIHAATAEVLACWMKALRFHCWNMRHTKPVFPSLSLTTGFCRME